MNYHYISTRWLFEMLMLSYYVLLNAKTTPELSLTPTSRHRAESAATQAKTFARCKDGQCCSHSPAFHLIFPRAPWRRHLAGDRNSWTRDLDRSLPVHAVNTFLKHLPSSISKGWLSKMNSVLFTKLDKGQVIRTPIYNMKSQAGISRLCLQAWCPEFCQSLPW